MPNTLPVPSKAALRTLRNLALGTSCTVAFTTGLLTEDRRRRIHSASEVHANAKKIKSSRKYHSVGGPSAESFEEQVLKYRNDGFWQTNDSPRIIEPAHPDRSSKSGITQLADSEQEEQLQNKRSMHIHTGSIATAWKPVSAIPKMWKPNPIFGPNPVSPSPPPIVKGQVRSRQQKLALDVIKLLQVKDDPSNVEAATARFLEAFEEGLPIHGSGLRKELMEAALQLSIACQAERKLQAHSKILDIILEHAIIDEDTFFSFGAEKIMNELLEPYTSDATRTSTVEESKLRKAASLYLTKFKEKPRIATDSWLSLGEKLCAITCRQGVHDLTELLYWRMDQCRGDAPIHSLTDLLTALFDQGYHAKVIKTFRRFFARTSPDKRMFYKTGNIIIESAMKIRRFDMAEEALATMAKISEDQGIYCPATWFAKVLRNDWESHRDIARTRPFFERLALKFHRVESPQAVYGAVIQCCVEAADEAAAQYFFERLERAHGLLDASGVRILGHFAYAKALRNDWAGVRTDFNKMWDLRPCSHDHKAAFKESYSASFIPIFTLFAKSHSVTETEEFLHNFIDCYNVILKPYMSTTMITKYAEAREIDPISRWFDYMASVGSPPDAMFFNAIISNCRKKWKFSFEETYCLYQMVRKNEGLAAHFINDTTFSILRGAAMAEARSDVAQAAKNLNRLKLDQPLRHSMDCMGVKEQMSIALSSGDPGKALRVFESAQKNNIIPLDIGSIDTAVRALLQLDPSDVRAAASLLRKPQSDGLDVSPAVATIFIHQMSYQCSGAKRVRVQDVARNTFAVLEERGLAIPSQMITHTMHTLVRQGKYYQATDFWDSMSRRQTGQASLDLQTLTVLLRAFLQVQDCVGVEWAVQMLPVNGLSPDGIFKRSLKNALREARKLLWAESASSEQRFYRVVEGALQSVSAMMQEARDDKEDFKIKTISIMEKAIDFQRTLDLDVHSQRKVKGQRVSRTKGSKSVVASQIGDDSELSRGWPTPSEPDYYVNMPPVSRLVGSL